MDRFVSPDKGEFLGREALLAGRERGLNYRLVTLEVLDPDDADALGNNALTRDGELIGARHRGGFGFRVDKSWRWAWLSRKYAVTGTEMEIDILNRNYRAIVIPESPFDPGNERLLDINHANK